MSESVDLWRRFFADAPDPCFVVAVRPDEALEIVAVNRAYEEQTGLPPDRVLGRSPARVLDPSVADTGTSRLLSVVASRRTASFVSRLRFPAGERDWRTHMVPVEDATGAVVALACMAHDITDALAKERTQAALAESEARYRRLAENAPDIIFRMRLVPSMALEYVSAAVTAMNGYTPEEMVADPSLLLRTIHPEDREPVRQRILSGKYDGPPITARVMTKDGGVRWIEPRSVPVLDAEGRLIGLEGVVRDVTERKLAEQERESLERRLQEAQRLESLGVLAGGIAHDFNNILTGILGSATLLERRLATGAAAADDVRQIEQAAHRAADLCRQMLAYAGQGRFVVEPIDLGALAREAASLVSMLVSKRATVSLRLDPDLPPVEGDATQIRQVIVNLVMNASEALGDRDGDITIGAGVRDVDAAYLRESVTAPDLPPGRYVCIEVADTGGGMTPETRARIFEPFFTTKFAGRGLGLSAVLGVVRGHRGAVRVGSEPGRGSTFTLLFPPAPADQPRAAPAAAAVAPWSAQGTVLLVDDEVLVRRVGAQMLRDCGFDVLEAANGAEGVARFREHADHIVAVVMDLTMPVMDGEAAFREIRRVRAGVPVLLMSGYDEQQVLGRFAGAGAPRVVEKPFTFDALIGKLRAALRA